MIRWIERRPAMFLLLCCAALFVLWLPGLRYPVVSDTLLYAQMGRSIVEEGYYGINGVSFSGQLPLHALLSYPFVRFLGINLGMHLLTLFGGWAVLVASFLLLRRLLEMRVAMLATIFILLQPGFVLISMLGSADLTFTALLLLSLWYYIKAQARPAFYLPCGIFLGLACLTRYNGLPFFPMLFLWAALRRQTHLRSPYVWIGFGIGFGIVGLWFLRNFLVFGDPLRSIYTDQLAAESDGPLLQIISNVMYYGNPLHNIFLLLPFALAGLFFHGRRQAFLLLSMASAWLLTAIWWVQAIRFAFPGYPMLLGFAALGARDVWHGMQRRFAKCPMPIASVLILSITMGFGIQGAFLCTYTYGRCNAWMDRTIGMLPPHIGLTPEGFESWAQAKDWINARASAGDVVVESGEQYGAPERIFRSDLRVTNDSAACPVLWITQHPPEGATILFTTTNEPKTSVVRRECN